MCRLTDELQAAGIDPTGHSLADAVMELKDGALTIAFRDLAAPGPAFAEMEPRLVIEDWNRWNHDYSSLQLADGASVNVAGLLDRCGVVDGGPPVEVGAVLAAIAAANGVDAAWIGGDGRDVLKGGDGSDLLDGGAGNDQLVGGAGDDILKGGAGADELDGGDGVDTVVYETSAEGVDVDLRRGSGRDGDADGDRLIDIENLVGSAHDDALAGTHGVNVLRAGDGDDMVEGRGGGDILDGGAGTDTLSYRAGIGGVAVDLGAGEASGGDAEGDVFAGFGSDILVGGEGDDTVVYAGNSGDYEMGVGDQGQAFVRSLLGDEDRLMGIEFIRFDDRTVAATELLVAQAMASGALGDEEDEEGRRSGSPVAAQTSATMMAWAAAIGIAAVTYTRNSSADTIDLLAALEPPAELEGTPVAADPVVVAAAAPALEPAVIAPLTTPMVPAEEGAAAFPPEEEIGAADPAPFRAAEDALAAEEASAGRSRPVISAA